MKEQEVANKMREPPAELANTVLITEDEKNRTLRVSALPGKSQIKLDEWQTRVLADYLSKIVQRWSEL